MAKSYKYTMDTKGFRDLANSAGIGQAMLAAAERGKDAAERSAPRGSTGEYSRSFETEQIEVEVQTKRGVERRAGAVLRNTAPHSLPVEAKHHTLRNVVDNIENGG